MTLAEITKTFIPYEKMLTMRDEHRKIAEKMLVMESDENPISI